MTGPQNEQLQLLLKQLASNDEFRAAFEANPVEVLAKFGLEVKPDEVPEKVALPSKETIAKNFDAMLDDTRSSCGVIFFAK